MTDITKDYVQTTLENEFNMLFPPLDRRGFKSDEEYRQALIQRYGDLRRYEYRMASERICLKYYNYGMEHDGKEQGRDNNSLHNKAMLKAENDKHTTDTIPLNNRIQNDIVLQDKTKSSPVNSDIMKDCYRFTSDQPTCAISASAREVALVKTLGLSNQIKIQPIPRATSNCLSVPEDYRCTPKGGCGPMAHRSIATREGGKPSCSELIQAGLLHAGDQFAQPADTNSGSHSMTIASIDYDDKGNPIGYTVQANNRTRLDYHKITDKGPHVNNIGQLGACIEDQIQEEVKNLQNMDTNHLEKKLEVQTERSWTETFLSALEINKAYNFANKADERKYQKEKAWARHMKQKLEKINKKCKESVKEDFIRLRDDILLKDPTKMKIDSLENENIEKILGREPVFSYTNQTTEKPQNSKTTNNRQASQGGR